MTGTELRNLRHEAGLSQEALAQLLAVSWSTVQRWEQRDELPERVARMVANAVQVGGSQET